MWQKMYMNVRLFFKTFLKLQGLKYIKMLKKKSLNTHKAYLGLQRLSGLTKVSPSLEKLNFLTKI